MAVVVAVVVVAMVVAVVVAVVLGSWVSGDCRDVCWYIVGF